jgi:hypothetical protein
MAIVRACLPVPGESRKKVDEFNRSPRWYPAAAYPDQQQRFGFHTILEGVA